jgi:hypothetical protein
MQTMSVDIDNDLAQRLELVAAELGARGLPLAAIVRALLLERATYLEEQVTAQRARDTEDT